MRCTTRSDLMFGRRSEADDLRQMELLEGILQHPARG
jgi:hypothetical protein